MNQEKIDKAIETYKKVRLMQDLRGFAENIKSVKCEELTPIRIGSLTAQDGSYIVQFVPIEFLQILITDCEDYANEIEKELGED